MEKITGRRLIITADGSHTIYLPELDEHYHSVFGAVQESKHIYINTGLKSCEAGRIDVFEAGFGTGLNALLSALYAEEHNRHISFTSVEKYPLPGIIYKEINYGRILGTRAAELFEIIHMSEWNQEVRISDSFTLKKIDSDLLSYNPTGFYDVIYFDAFGPDKQPEMWSAAVFGRISLVTRKGGVLVTYSSKGDVKRNLRECGFRVVLLPGPPGKRHIIKAIKN